MKRIAPILILALALLAGCSKSTNISTDYVQGVDFASFQTYAWMNEPVASEGEDTANRPALMVRDSVDKQLQAKGLRKVSEGADVMVFYYLGTKQAVASSDKNPTWNDPTDNDATAKIANQGTLILDLMDPGTKKRVWRGTIERAMQDEATPDQRRRNIDGLVGKLFKKYPPSD